MATILVVDDLAANRKLLVRLLGSDGHRILEAANGHEGLAAVRAEHPDLVITDVLMPVMDGYELVRQLRLDPATREIPVVFFTAHYGEREARALALASGVCYVVTKPCDTEDMRKLVGRVLAGERSAGAPTDGAPLTSDFIREHLRLLTDKLSTSAGALRNANARLRALINLGLEFASERDPDRLLQNVCAATHDLFGATYVTLGIVDTDSRAVQRVVASGVEIERLPQPGDAVQGILASIVADRRSFRVENPNGDLAVFDLPSSHPEARTLLAAPIASPTQVYGWICLVGNEGRSFTEDDEQLVTALAGQVGRIYENACSHELERLRAEKLERAIFERQQVNLEREQLVLTLEERNGALSAAIAHLRASEAQLLPLKQSIAGMLEGIQIIDRQWRYVYLNEAAARHGRSTPAALVGRSILECYPGVETTPAFAAMTAVMETQTCRQLQTEFVFADGGTGWFQLSIEPDPSGILVRSIDITEHRNVDAELRTSRAELLEVTTLQAAMFNSAFFSCIATDATGVIQLVSVGAERLLGCTAEEVIHRSSPAELYDAQEIVARAAALSLEFGVPIVPGFEALVFKAARGIEDIHEVTKIRNDGSRFHAVLSITALRDAEERIIGYLFISTDNTERHEVEEERKKLDQRLRDQQFYTRSLIESNIDALITTDPRGIISDVNLQMEALTGCTRDELIGAPFKSYFTEPERARAAIQKVLSEQKVTNFELTARARNGKETVVSYNATTFYDRERRLQGVFAAARDVTDRKLVEQTLLQKNIELEAASRMKSEFLANMSHELRTPLNAIIGFSEAMKDGLVGEVTDQQRGFITDIFGSGTHLLSLINDILDLSKVEAGKMQLDVEPVDLSPLFANSLSVLNEKAAGNRIRLRIEAGEDLGSIRADARKIKQIVYNLLSNGVKFTAEGGEVTLRVERVPRADVGHLPGIGSGRRFALPDSSFQDFVEISVTDTGIGISPIDLAGLFLTFSQIDGGLARRFEGTGLGLAMVKLLAELHGGTVAVESAVGEGSCFKVWLPCRSPGEAELPSPTSPSTIPLEALAGARLALVVDGDVKSAGLIRLQLESEGFKVLHAPSAETALILARQQPLALITLAILLPDVDGWELLRRIKEEPELSSIPVVIISIAADRGRGLALGAAAVLQKPVSRLELNESLGDLCLLLFTPGKQLKVLVVDDDPMAVQLIAIRLKDFTGTVLRASRGHEAIEVARQEAPDAIILDLMMPELNGFDVVAALKADPETARIPILVVTAKQVTAEDRATLNGYVTSILAKGAFDRDHFTNEVHRAIAAGPVAA